MADWFTMHASVFFTFCLVAVGVGQLILFYVQLRLIRKSLDDAHKAAKASASAAMAATRQAEIAEKSFADLERPYIYVFGAEGLKLDDNTPDPYHFLEYSVANYGKTPATIVSVQVGICVGPLPEYPHKIGGWHNLLVSPILIPSERRNDLIAAVPEPIEIGEYADEDTPPIPVPTLEDGNEFFFWVQIRYHGPFSKSHETSACWHWSNLRLSLYGGDEYNYIR